MNFTPWSDSYGLWGFCLPLWGGVALFLGPLKRFLAIGTLASVVPLLYLWQLRLCDRVDCIG